MIRYCDIMDIKPYLDQIQANNLSKYAIDNYRKTLTSLNEFKSIESITKADLIVFFNQLDYADSTIRLQQSLIKKFFIDIGKSELVSWIQYVKPKETLKSDDILTTDDINKLINATDSHYWKALIAFLFETGCRISEAQAIRYKDIANTDQGMIINIPTSKTSAGYRKVILPFSTQYIRNLKTYTDANQDDLIFSIKHTATALHLHEIAEKAGITKPVTPHKMRHAQATDLVKRGYNEAIIRKKLGWTATSGMIARYQHLNDEDVINATLENIGKLPQTTAPRTEIREADKVTLVEASMQFSKLSEENSELKTRLDEMEAQRKKDMSLNEDIIKTMIEKRVSELLKKG